MNKLVTFEKKRYFFYDKSLYDVNIIEDKVLIIIDIFKNFILVKAKFILLYLFLR